MAAHATSDHDLLPPVPLPQDLPAAPVPAARVPAAPVPAEQVLDPVEPSLAVPEVAPVSPTVSLVFTDGSELRLGPDDPWYHAFVVLAGALRAVPAGV